jgi:hypothetical protein
LAAPQFLAEGLEQAADFLLDEVHVAVASLVLRQAAGVSFVEFAAWMNVADSALLVYKERDRCVIPVLGEPPVFERRPIAVNCDRERRWR